MAGGILVVSEHMREELSEITYEMLGVGRRIADSLNVPLYSIIVGENIDNLASNLGQADTIFMIDSVQSNVLNPETVASLLKEVIEQKLISLILIGGTNLSIGVGPFLSAQTQLPFINFCTDIDIEDSKVTFTSQLFGGKILTNICLSENQGIVSIYPGSFPAEEGKIDRTPTIENLVLTIEESAVTFKGFIEPDTEDVDISRQDVLIAIGRGIKTQENIELADDLAQNLGGIVCGSRPVIDQGWLPLSRQVGKSGKIVKPRLYLALGVSGAPEHMEGMQNAELIIPINSDPEAPIFSIAHYGINKDLFDILPSLIEEIKARKGAA
jgi:electron transfer flavoprotein alpha subunit